MKIYIPPIKSQGIKTKLVPVIRSALPVDYKGKWIEPFFGTGVVGFNIAQNNALLCDTNPHLVNFYNAILSKKITADKTRKFLEKESVSLLNLGEDYYYEVRERFNQYHNPLDFLFLNRAGFNGMIRFNKKGNFNIPFCKKTNRFAKAYVTKIVNQVNYISILLEAKKFEFKNQSFENTIMSGSKHDLIYCDPPYIDRHTDYYNDWCEEDERLLFKCLSNCPSKFILSTWHHNDYRENIYMKSLWSKFNVITREHFYHVGGNEKNRNPMIEAIVTNYPATFLESLKIESKETVNKYPLFKNIALTN